MMYARNKQLQNMIDVVKSVSSSIRMSSGLEKWAILLVSRECGIDAQNLQSDNEEQIEFEARRAIPVPRYAIYPSLRERNARVQGKFKKWLRSVLGIHLSGKLNIKAVNTWLRQHYLQLWDPKVAWCLSKKYRMMTNAPSYIIGYKISKYQELVAKLKRHLNNFL